VFSQYSESKFISHRLSMVGHRPSSSISAGCVVPLRGNWAIFCHAGLGRAGGARKKSLEILKSWLWIEPRSQGGQTVSYPTELSWPRPQGGQTVSYPTELSWPRPQGGQTVSYPTELSWPRPQGGQTVSYPTELSWPRPQGGQTVSYPTELSWLTTCRSTINKSSR